MSEEDKKFLDKFKNEIYSRTNASFDVIEEMEGTEEKEAALKYHGDLHHLVYIIEKLQKENEEYKLLNANIEKANRIIEGKEKYISKDKIREKIKELEQQKDLFFEKAVIQGRIDLLKELLEED